jgi:hypothetical protein
MENIYNAYTKEINGKTFYFVKKFIFYPEIKDSSPILDKLGMHTNFHKACSIAEVHDEQIINRLMSELRIIPESARVIHLQKAKAVTHSLLKNTQHALLKFKFASSN